MRGTRTNDTQFEHYVDVLGRHTTIGAAAAELGVTGAGLGIVFRRRGDSAVNYLQKPNFAQTIPDGHRIKGNSTLLDDDGETLKRWVKTERDSQDPPDVAKVPEGFTIKKVSTAVDGQGKVRYQWTQADQAAQDRWEAFWKACESASAKYKGAADPIAMPRDVLDRLLVAYPLGDPHVGMLAWLPETGGNFDLRICERDLIRVVEMLVDRAPAGKRALLVNLGDFYHSENDAQLTPGGGNKLDVDGRRAKVIELGLRIMRRLVDLLLQKHAEVTVHNMPGNHDPSLATMIAMWLRAVYEREPRVTIADANNPYQYVRFGKNLLGIAHGDGAKMEALPEIMATDRPEDWGATLYRLWLTGHVHHRRVFDGRGCSMESFRTLAPRDAWHNHRGYRSRQSLSCITFDEEFGEIARSTVDLRLGRAGA